MKEKMRKLSQHKLVVFEISKEEHLSRLRCEKCSVISSTRNSTYCRFQATLYCTVVATLLDGDTIQYYNGNADGNGSETHVTETCTSVRKRRMGSSVRILLGVGTE